LSNLPIVLTDTCGAHLEIDRRGYARARQDGDVLLRTSGGRYFVLAADVDLMAAICEAAGKPAPIVLERPELAGTHSQFPGIRVGPDRDLLAIEGNARLAWFMARQFAAHVVARADMLESAEPDPADVAALADVIRENSTSMRSDGTARAILRAGYRPPERKDGER